MISLTFFVWKSCSKSVSWKNFQWILVISVSFPPSVLSSSTSRVPRGEGATLVDSDTASSWTETFSERIGEASWGIVGELLVDPEGWSVDGVWRVRVVTHCRVNQTLGVWVLYITSLVSESMNWVLKTHREERVSSLMRWLLETRAI